MMAAGPPPFFITLRSMAQVILSPVPAGSALQDRLKTAYFHDSYQLQLPDDGSSPMRCTCAAWAARRAGSTF